MKKFLIMSVMALGMTSFLDVNVLSAQETTLEGVKKEFSKVMAIFVEEVAIYYQEGLSYADFKSKVVGNEELPSAGEKILSEAYNQLKNGTPIQEILNNENGSSLMYYLSAVASTKDVDHDIEKTFGKGNITDKTTHAICGPKFIGWLKKTGNWLLDNVLGPVLVSILTIWGEHLLGP